jgi:hypothetical protein
MTEFQSLTSDLPGSSKGLPDYRQALLFAAEPPPDM